jgi:hypothetical protein
MNVMPRPLKITRTKTGKVSTAGQTHDRHSSKTFLWTDHWYSPVRRFLDRAVHGLDCDRNETVAATRALESSAPSNASDGGGTLMKSLFGQDNVIRLSSSVRTAEPDAARALEQAWLKRRQELAGWRPSGGWLVEQKAAVRRSFANAR